MLAGRCFGLAGETVGELATVVGEQLVDLRRRGAVQPSQEIGAAGLAPIGVDAQMAQWPGRSSRTRSAGVFVGHLRQVLDVDVDEHGP